MELETKHGIIKIYAKTIENEALSQIIQMSNSPLGKNANIRIMPDCHAGIACVIGTTMLVTDKVCPNLVGVDIGCGVSLVKTDIDFKNNLDNLDKVIRKYIPYGNSTHTFNQKYDFSKLRCWNKLSEEIKNVAYQCLGTLGGGNHFIEAYNDGYLSVHTGSRNIGYRVADYYQKLAKKTLINKLCKEREEQAQSIEINKREKWLNQHPISVIENLCYLEGQDMDDYLHDVAIMQQFANDNRHTILEVITKNLGGKILSEINSTHNYIDTKQMILRKGAISAQKDEMLVIPMNMKDGILICKGKGNPDWNFSAPHGAGRLYPRSAVKSLFSVEEYAMEMEGIYTTCVGESTLDEAPFVYKNCKEIIECIEPTVEILKQLFPIYNFKAN